MIDRGGSGKRTYPSGSTFLSVPVSTLTREQIERKAKREKAAADKRAKKVNEVIEKQNKAILNALYYPRQAERVYETGVTNNSGPRIIQSVKTMLYNPPKNPNTNTVKGFNYSYGTGQYSVARPSVEAFRYDNTPHTIRDYARVAAKADTTTDIDVYNWNNRNRIDPRFHHDSISAGEIWLADSDAYTDWILSAATDDEANRRIRQAKKYYEQAFHDVPTYDPSTNTYSVQTQIREDTPLPPWIAQTAHNKALWAYYTTYSNEVVASAVHAYNEARDDGREYARTPYKSAFAGSESKGQVDSFLDVVIDAITSSSSFEEFDDKFIEGLYTYGRDYIVNPIRAGKLKTAAGNALWNMMDTMDVASRGVRALVAGETALGGTGGREFKNANSAFDDYYAKTWEKYGVAPSEEYERNKNHGTWERRNDATFKGQNVYWANIKGHSPEDIQRAQTLFMDHGGYALLLDKHPDFANKAQMAEMASLSDADRTAIIQELDNIFAGSDINWRDIYKDIDKNYFNQDRVNKGFKQGVKNIKEAYTDVDANFNADTGSMLADIIIETTLDPGTMVGGIAKNAAKKGVSSAAEIAVSEGFKHILIDADDADAILKNKSVRQALNSLISSNEGRNIIFKKADDFENDVDLFIAKLRKAGVFSNATMDPAIGAGDDVANAFKKIVTSHLMDKNVSVNGAIIAAQDFARKSIDNKAFKAAYYMDKAIDGIDSAIIKSSFFLPWAGLRGARALGHEIVNTAANSEFLAKALARFNLKKANATQTLLDDITGEVNVTKVSDLMTQFENGLHNESSVRYALSHVIDQYDNVTWHVNDIIRKFSRGEISEVDALKEIGDHIYQITGGKYRYVRELGGYVDELAVRYAGDIKSAFGRIDDTYSRLLNMIDRRSENAIEGFLDEVRQAQTMDDLTRLFREHMDNEYIMALRREVVENSQLDITVEDVDRLVNQLNMGLFSDKSVTQEIVHTGVKAQSKMAEKTLRRTVSFEQFGKILDDMGIDWKELVISGNIEDSSVSKFEKKLSEFMAAWAKQSYVTYNVDDALKFVDRLYRQIHFKELLNKNVASEVSALAAHQLTTECAKLRKQIKRLDLVNLKDVKYIILPQLDRMALHQSFINDANIQNLYGGFYDDVIAPLVAEFSKMTSDEIDLMDSSLFKDVDDLAKQKYGFDRTQQLVEEAKTLKGFSDEHLHSFLNTLATDFRFRDLESGEIVLTPGMLRRRVEATLRAQTGHSKVGMKNITDSLQSLNSDNPSEFLKPYWEEMQANPALQARLDRYIQTDVLDPRSYVEKQMLYTVLADPSVITEWNALAAKGQTPIMFHVNTTGLNSEINSMTSVTFRQWVPIEITEEKPLTLERLLDAMDSGETTVIQRGMTDSELNEFTEQVIRQLDIKDCDPSNIMKRYKGYYGVSDTRAYKSEEDMIEEACAYIRATSRQVDDGTGALRSVAPTLVVHDLDGFNVSYFNDKVGTMARATDENTATYDYIHRVSRSAKDNSCNTYTRLAEQAGDLYYTEEQLDEITELLHSYIDDINHFAPDYKMNDMQSYSRKLHDIVKTLNLKKDANELTEQEEAFLDLFQKADGSTMLGAYDNAVKNITALGLYPRQYAFVSSGLEDNFTKAALEATGRTSVNVNSRLYVDDILSYFDLETEDGFYAPVEDLKQMHAMAQYITRTRNRQIVAGAEEFLVPHKADFDRVIQSVIDIAKGNSYEGIKLAYMQNMRIPDNAIDSYLMAKKLYNDHIKYWLDTDELTSLRTNGKDLDAMKQKLYAMGKQLGFDDPRYLLERDTVFGSACDYYNDHRIRMFDEVTGGGFDNLRADEIDALMEQYEHERLDFWQSVSEDMKQIWGDFKEENATRWSDVSKNSKEKWQSFKEENAERFKQVSEKAKERAARRKQELKEANKNAKQSMIDANKADYEKYRVFKGFLEDLYNPAFESIQEGFKAFRQAKEEKWDYFFGVVKPERDHLDNLISEAEASGDRKLLAQLRQQRKAVNARWQNYNENYMNTWFTNVSRDYVDEPYTFKDQNIAAKYTELERRERSYRKLFKERGDEKFLIEAEDAKAKMEELAKYADNYNNRGGWLQWHGDLVLSDLETKLREEFRSAKHGTLDPDHSILFGNNNEVKTTYRQFIQDEANLDAVKHNTEERYVDYRTGLEDRFNERYLITPEGKVVSQDLEGELIFREAMEDTEDAYNRVVEGTQEAFNSALEETEEAYEEAQLNSALRYREAEIAYDNLVIWQTEDTYNRLDDLRSDLFDKSSGVLDLLQGAHEPEIYNYAARSDFEKNVLTYRDGVMKYGLDKAAKYSEAGSQIASDMRQLQHMDEYFAAAGILRNSDRFTASVYRKTDQLFKILDNTGFLKRESFHTFMQKAAELQRLQLHEYRFNALKNADGVFDRDKLLSELVYNGFNMTVFNSHNYSVADMKELREFVQDLKNKGDDFLSYYEDRTTGNVYVYLNDGAQVAEADGARWINQSIRLERPKYGVVPHADFDELAQVLDIDDIEDYRGVYAHLRSCWEDTRLLSLGQINGTTGRTVSRRQADEFIQSLPANMNDWCTSEGLLRDELTRGVIYDPGFVINDQTDMLTDFLGTLQRQAETAKDDCILINEVFHSNGAVHLNDLAEHFSTDELIDYFGENPEYVVCTIVADDRTATGFKVQQINMSNRAGVEIAKNTENTTILPYSTFYDITNYMNRDVGEDVQKQLLGKYMLVYKAFALVKPGTWMRNYIDATIKASFNNGGGAGDVVNMLQYEGIAARYIGDYGRILQSDASLLTPANWDIVQQTYKTSMTYEDFELLRGVMDSDRYKSADKYFLSRTARQRQGFNVISGENIGLRNLDRKDINEAFEKYLATDTDLPLTRKEFLDIYNGDVIPDEAMKDQFDDMYRRLTNNMRNSNVANIFDKTIDTMFKPFGTVEELVRFAQTMQLRDNGLSPNQIVRNIHNTQFYTAPMQGTWRTLENIVPFITFKYNNMMYWVRMMEENPRLFRYFEDTYRSVYETTLESALQEGMELDYETDYGLQSGGIPLGSGKYYFNIGSSFLSAIGDFYGMSHDIDSLNPLIRDSVRASMYALGLNSKEFFSDIDLDISDDDITQKVLAAVPGYSLIKTGMRTFKNIEGLSTESGGPSVQALFYLLNGLGAIGIRNQYGKNGDDFSFQEWKEELEEQGKWYDANLGKVVPLSQKNEYGANDPNASFQDIQAYMLVHFGKLWDANQRKFVPMDQYTAGGYNESLDFENDPEGAWKQLCDYMGKQGKKWDANQRKFVLPKDYIAGGLNAENLEWDTVVALMQEKFPDLIYDANQQTFVEKKYYIAGGLNDFSQYEGQDFLRHWNELKSIRYALYGETYDKASHKFIKTAEPSVVTIYDFMDIDVKKQYDNYYNMLGIPRLQVADKPLIVKDGVLMTTDGKYVITGNAEHDAKIFDKVRDTFGYQGRRYSGHRRYSYSKTRKYNKKPYKGRPTPSTYYSSVGWATHDYNGTDGYKFEFNYQFQYHSPQPASKLHRLITPPIFYPYGGGYNKFSFQARV
jgi:hypothetical protein